MHYDLQKNIDFIIEKKRKVILFAIMLLALALQLYGLDQKSLWYDERASLLFSSLNLKDILASPDKPHPPLYYIIEHFFILMKNNEFFMRLPSVIFSFLTIPLIYRLGKDLFDFRVALMSAFLLANSPMFYWHAQEARMYPLFNFFSLLSLIFFIQALRTNETKVWVCFIALNLLNLYTHYYAVLVILIEASFLLIYSKKYSYILGRFVLSNIAIFLFFVPQLFSLYSGILLKAGEGPTWGIRPTWLFVPEIFCKISIGYCALPDFKEYFYKIIEEGAFQFNLYFLSTNLFVLILLAFFFYGAYVSRQECSEKMSLLLIWVLIPIAINYIMASKIDIMVRYIIFILPIYLVLVSKGLIYLREKNFLCFFIFFFAISGFNAYFLFLNHITTFP